MFLFWPWPGIPTGGVFARVPRHPLIFDSATLAQVDEAVNSHLGRIGSACLDRGADAQRSDIHGQAIREYTKAVCLLMEHVRDAMNKNASDSSIEL